MEIRKIFEDLGLIWPRAGAAVGQGWMKIVEPALRAMKKIDPNIRIDQIKEKFGGLRIYFAASDPILYDMLELVVNGAESKAWHTCEECGELAERVNDEGWIRTICDSCMEKGKKSLR